MEWSEKYINRFVRIFVSSFGSAMAFFAAFGGGMIQYYCSANAPTIPFLNLHLAGNPYCELVSAFILIISMTIGLMILFLLGAIVLDIVIWVFKILKRRWIRFIDWLKTPSPMNVHLYSGSVYNNVVTLKFKCTEWKYLFHKIRVSVYTPVLYMRNDLPQTAEYFSWTKGENRMKIGKIYEVDLIEFDIDKKLFWIKANNIEEEKYKFPGKLGRQVNVEVVFIRPIDNKELTSVRRFFYVETTFQNHKEISIKMKSEFPVWEITL